MNILDLSVFIISVIGIFLEMYQKPIFWLTYIVSAIILGYQFYVTHLYGSFSLQLLYVIISIYGWYKWRSKTTQNETNICHTSLIQWIHYALATLVIGIIIYFILRYTEDQDYLIDTVLTTICVCASYMAALKQIESWFVFTSTVFISVPLYFHYHLYFTCITYAIFGILDLSGGIKWLMDYKKTVNVALVN